MIVDILHIYFYFMIMKIVIYIFLYSYYMDLPEYMIWLFLYHFIDMKLLLLDHIDNWHMVCETKWYIKLSATRSKVPYYIYTWWRPPLESVGAISKIHGATSRISYLLNLISHIILLNNLDTTHIMLSWYMLLALLLSLIYCVI